MPGPSALLHRLSAKGTIVAPMRRLRFYFDYISTNAYLAWVALPALAAKHDLEIEPVPVLFAGLLGAHGQLGPAEVPVKAYWMWKNNLRKAALLGVPLEPPAFHPFNPLLALRVSSLPLAAEERRALIDALFRAVWVEGRHVSEPAVVEEVARRLGLDGAALVRDAGAPAAKARLRSETDDAIARGVFGVPSMLVGDELFWGYDDLPYLDRFLAGRDPIDAARLPTAETAPRPSAVRPRR
jgi:2-hydroxychromene-2-carboxylate isomerase